MEEEIKALSTFRSSILKKLARGYAVVIYGPPKSGKSLLASRVMSSKMFRSLFIPLIDYDNINAYKELLVRGGWSKNPRYYFIDSWDAINVKIDVPSLIVSQVIPSRDKVEIPLAVYLTDPRAREGLENADVLIVSIKEIRRDLLPGEALT